MGMSTPSAARWLLPCRLSLRAGSCLAAVLGATLVSGCTALTNPVADGIPVRLLPVDLWGPSKAHLQTIPLNLLSQPQPDVHRLAGGDVLGVYIDGFLGERALGMPVHMTPTVQARDQFRLLPSAGYPVPVMED